jgi:hypothetical protein
MRTPPARRAQFLNAPLRRGGDSGLFWSFPTVDLLLRGVDAVSVALGAKGEKILDPVSMRVALTEHIADPPPAFCVFAIASATGGRQKTGVWHAGRVTSHKGKGLALMLIVDATSMETIIATLNRQFLGIRQSLGIETSETLI